MMNRSLPLMMLLFLVFVGSASAGQRIVVQALFPGKTVVLIDGQRRVISVGDTSPEGFKLIAADTNKATLEIDGKQTTYTLGSSISLDFSEAKSIQEKVFSDERGMFMSVGSINGRTVRFLVDTGATTIAMNTSQAKRLGVRYEKTGVRSTASTASGFVNAYRVRLKSVSLGKIKRQNIEAMVIDGQHPGPILLGMSFLGDLKVDKTGNTLILKTR